MPPNPNPQSNPRISLDKINQAPIFILGNGIEDVLNLEYLQHVAMSMQPRHITNESGKDDESGTSSELEDFVEPPVKAKTDFEFQIDFLFRHFSLLGSQNSKNIHSDISDAVEVLPTIKNMFDQQIRGYFSTYSSDDLGAFGDDESIKIFDDPEFLLPQALGTLGYNLVVLGSDMVGENSSARWGENFEDFTKHIADTIFKQFKSKRSEKYTSLMPEEDEIDDNKLKARIDYLVYMHMLSGVIEDRVYFNLNTNKSAKTQRQDLALSALRARFVSHLSLPQMQEGLNIVDLSQGVLLYLQLSDRLKKDSGYRSLGVLIDKHSEYFNGLNTEIKTGYCATETFRTAIEYLERLVEINSYVKRLMNNESLFQSISELSTLLKIALSDTERDMRDNLESYKDSDGDQLEDEVQVLRELQLRVDKAIYSNNVVSNKLDKEIQIRHVREKGDIFEVRVLDGMARNIENISLGTLLNRVSARIPEELPDTFFSGLARRAQTMTEEEDKNKMRLIVETIFVGLSAVNTNIDNEDKDRIDLKRNLEQIERVLGLFLQSVEDGDETPDRSLDNSSEKGFLANVLFHSIKPILKLLNSLKREKIYDKDMKSLMHNLEEMIGQIINLYGESSMTYDELTMFERWGAIADRLDGLVDDSEKALILSSVLDSSGKSVDYDYKQKDIEGYNRLRKIANGLIKNLSNSESLEGSANESKIINMFEYTSDNLRLLATSDLLI